MTRKELVESKFNSGQVAPVFLPDLRIWYDWQEAQDTLPRSWQGKSLDDIYRDLSIPVWRVVRPWRVDSPYPIATSEENTERKITIDVDGTTITSRWSQGPDGDWWQTEYPAKSADDLGTILAFVESRSYQTDLVAIENALGEVGDDGIAIVDLPARPFSWLMLEMLGWSDGLMLLLDAEDIVARIVDVADRQLQTLVSELAGCQGLLFYSPDNLDGQFISPAYFSEYLAPSYAASSRALHESGKHLLVHAGGPVSRLLEPIADVGIDGVVGICGPPQGDSPMEEARAKSGDALVLIGGVPQDHLLPTVGRGELDRAIDQMISVSEKDPRTIVSIADHVPIDAEIDRLQTIAERLAP